MINVVHQIDNNTRELQEKFKFMLFSKHCG